MHIHYIPQRREEKRREEKRSGRGRMGHKKVKGSTPEKIGRVKSDATNHYRGYTHPQPKRALPPCCKVHVHMRELEIEREKREMRGEERRGESRK